MNTFYIAAVSVFLITCLAYVSLGNAIKKVRNVAKNEPNRLRNVTSQDALLKADSWEKARKRLWPSAIIVIAGFIIWGTFGS